mmetsp:Transcript_23282/g.38316  ORF Transcript_23282/g.38316 Transcript_23282/m.38316 type:complete len:135 (+) Transcript_23282:1-405(+)
MVSVDVSLVLRAFSSVAGAIFALAGLFLLWKAGIAFSLHLIAAIYFVLLAATLICAELGVGHVYAVFPWLQTKRGRGIFSIVIAIPMLPAVGPFGTAAGVILLFNGVVLIAASYKLPDDDAEVVPLPAGGYNAL